MGRFSRWLTSLIWWGVVVLIVLLATSLVVFKQVLPFANEYRTQIERNLTQIVGYPITIERISANLTGLDPTFAVDGISLDTQKSVPAVHVEQLLVRIDFVKSLLNLAPHFTYIRFIKPEIEVVELAGQWALLGMGQTASDKTAGASRILDYLAAQRQFTVLDASVHLTSEAYGDAVFSTDALYIQKTPRGVGLTAQLRHDQQAEAFSVAAELEVSDSSDGYIIKAHVQTPQLRFTQQQFAVLESAKLASLTSKLNLWLRYQSDKNIQLSGFIESSEAVFDDSSRLNSRADFIADYDFTKQQMHLSVADLQVQEGDGGTYPAINFNLNLDLAEKARTFGLKFDRFDLRLGQKIAELYMDPAWFASRLISQMQPQGVAENGSLRLSLDAPSEFQYLSNFSKVSGAGFSGIPSVTNLAGVFSLSADQGYIEFQGRNSRLGFPGLYDEAWSTQALSGLVEWRSQQDVFLVSGQDLNVERNGADINGKFRLEIRPDQADWMLLDLQGANVSVADRLTYIPNKVLNQQTRDWIDTSLAGGNVKSVAVVFQSELNDVATPHVRVSLDLEDVQVAFAPDWPPAKQVYGQFTLDENGILVQVDSASLATLDVSDIAITLPFSANKVNWLTVSGIVNDDLGDVLSVLRTTNLAKTALKPFSAWSASGPAVGRFDVSIPLDESLGEPVVQLGLQFEDNLLDMQDINLKSSIKQGQINFHSKKGLSDSFFDVVALGGESHITLQSKQLINQPMEIIAKMAGSANIYQLLRWRSMPDLMLDAFTGDVSYQGDLSINRAQEGQIELTLQSRLVGASIGLPEPLRKSPDQEKTFDFELRSYGEDLLLKMAYDDRYRTRLALHAGTLVGGQLFVNQPTAFSEEITAGFELNGQMSVFDWPAWLTYVEPYFPAKDTGIPNTAPFEIPSWLNNIQFIFDSLVVDDANELHNLKVSFDRAKSPDKFQIDSDELNLRLGRDDHGYVLHAGYISWNATADSDEAPSARLAPFKASQVPNVSIQVDELFYNGRSYGDWFVKVTNEGNRLRLQPLSTKLTHGEFIGNIFWQDDGDRSNVELLLSINGSDVGELTRKFSPTPFLTSKNYKIEVNLSWLGHPFYFDRESVSGRIAFDAAKGKFTQVDELPPFLRALGIFNINALMRRLTLDFSDVYQPGLTYDAFNGVLTLQKGIVETTTPIEIHSPTAEIVLAGKADLVSQTLDERLTATFPLGNTLPLAGLLLGAPQLAGLIYITDKLIGDQLAKVTSVQYQIKGPFDNPDIQPVKFSPREK